MKKQTLATFNQEYQVHFKRTGFNLISYIRYVNFLISPYDPLIRFHKFIQDQSYLVLMSYTLNPNQQTSHI